MSLLFAGLVAGLWIGFCFGYYLGQRDISSPSQSE